MYFANALTMCRYWTGHTVTKMAHSKPTLTCLLLLHRKEKRCFNKRASLVGLDLAEMSAPTADCAVEIESENSVGQIASVFVRMLVGDQDESSNTSLPRHLVSCGPKFL
jgi:hypothetical protein